MEGEEGEEEYCTNVCALTNEGWISLLVDPVEKTVHLGNEGSKREREHEMMLYIRRRGAKSVEMGRAERIRR
jgi:hypothetical protein